MQTVARRDQFLKSVATILNNATCSKFSTWTITDTRVGTPNLLIGGTVCDIVEIEAKVGLQQNKPDQIRMVSKASLAEVYASVDIDHAECVSDPWLLYRPPYVGAPPIRVLYSDTYGVLFVRDSFLPQSAYADVYWAGGARPCLVIPTGYDKRSDLWLITMGVSLPSPVAQKFHELAKTILLS